MSRNGVDYTVEQLSNLLRDIEPRKLKNALKGAMRSEASHLQRKARQRFLSGTSMNDKSSVAKAIRGRLKRDNATIEVSATANPKTGKGMTRNRKGKLKPLARWANTGVGVNGSPRRWKTKDGRRTGDIAAIDFIGKTQREEVPGAERRLVDAYKKRALKAIGNYGKL